MPIADQFSPGATSLPAAALKEVAVFAERTREVEADVGGTIMPAPSAGAVELAVFVTARGVSTPRPLSEHTYTISVAGRSYDIGWRELRVPFAYDVVRPGATTRVRFVPAAVVGDSEYNEQPWRAQGRLVRMPDTRNGKPTAFVELYGLGMDVKCNGS